MRRVGNDTVVGIAEALANAVKHAEVGHLDLPLADAGTPHVAEESRALGFFYAGLLPEYCDGDILRMQRLGHRTVEAATPVLDTPAGRAITDLVMNDAPA